MFSLLFRNIKNVSTRVRVLRYAPHGLSTLALVPPISQQLAPTGPQQNSAQHIIGNHYIQEAPIPTTPGSQITWNQFCYQMLAKGEVKKIIIGSNPEVVGIILHDNAFINGKPAATSQYMMRVSDLKAFEEKVRDFERQMGIKAGDEVQIVYHNSTLPSILNAAILLGLIYFISKNLKINVSGPQNILSGFSKAKFTLVDPAKVSVGEAASSIRFKDVAGLEEAKVEVMEFVDYLKNSEKYLKLGAKLPKGALLTGPPGCGKTLLAKAVASESNVPFLALAGSDFVEMIGGVGASRVRSLFKQANKLAPCIIYIDEIDSIGKKRSTSANFQNDESERTLNQLLVEMDGMTTRKSVVVLASTNRAEVLDAALLRPGRFDRQILIDLPNFEERRQLFELHASKIKLDEPASQISRRIAHLTPGMSGADIANVCNEAALNAARKKRPRVTADDIEYAIERVVGGTEKRSSSMSPEERKVIAYHESGHALVAWLTPKADQVLKVSIVPRTNAILGFAQYVPSDLKLRDPSNFQDMMCMALGGRVAELIKFNHLSTGASNDLKRVTEMATAMVKQYGFDEAIGHLSFDEHDPIDGPVEYIYSKKLAELIDKRVNLIIRQAFERTHKLLSDNVDKLNLLAEALLKNDVIKADDIEQLIGPRPQANQE